MIPVVITWALTTAQIVVVAYGVKMVMGLRRQHKQNARILKTVEHVKQLLPDPESKEWGDQKALLEKCLQAVYDPGDRRN